MRRGTNTGLGEERLDLGPGTGPNNHMALWAAAYVLETECTGPDNFLGN